MSPLPPSLASADPRLIHLLRLADDNLILSQRLGALAAHMPELEEDIAIVNIGLDHLGQARHLYTHASQFDAEGRDEDQFAMLRSEREFLNAVLVEQPDLDFAHTAVRQLFVDAHQVSLYRALAGSTDEALAGIAAKAEKEARYHLEWSTGWVITLGDGTSESHDRAQAAVDALWPFAPDLWAADEVESELAAQGIAVDPTPFEPGWFATVGEVLTAASLEQPADPYRRTGGRQGFHTEHLGHLLGDLQGLYRAHPGAQW